MEGRTIRGKRKSKVEREVLEEKRKRRKNKGKEQEGLVRQEQKLLISFHEIMKEF